VLFIVPFLGAALALRCDVDFIFNLPPPQTVSLTSNGSKRGQATASTSTTKTRSTSFQLARRRPQNAPLAGDAICDCMRARGLWLVFLLCVGRLDGSSRCCGLAALTAARAVANEREQARAFHQRMIRPYASLFGLAALEMREAVPFSNGRIAAINQKSIHVGRAPNRIALICWVRFFQFGHCSIQNRARTNHHHRRTPIASVGRRSLALPKTHPRPLYVCPGRSKSEPNRPENGPIQLVC
jgi:hypothetical protein